MDQRTQWTRWTRWTDRLTRTALLLAAGLGALWLARRLAGPLVPVLLATQFWCRRLGKEFVGWVFSPP